jgi:serine protease Do
LLPGCRSRGYQQQTSLQPADSCSNKNLTTEALFEGAKAGVAVVQAGSMAGSAFVVRQTASATFLATNSHVVGQATKVSLKWSDGSLDTGSVVANAGASTPQSDLALIEVSGIRGRALTLKKEPSSVGADIIAIGAPQGLEFSLTRGVVSSLRDKGEILQIDASINPGNSGGPILDKSGCVLGIVTFKLDNSEGLNFAISSSLIEAFLRRSNFNSGPLASSGGFSLSINTPLLSPPSSGQVLPEPTPIQGSNCWFQNAPGSQQLVSSQCQIISSIVSQGRIDIKLIDVKGVKRALYLYSDKHADVYFNGKRFNGSWSQIQDGYIRVHTEIETFAFKSLN